MTELADHELLAEFGRTESEAAFAEIVARHVNLVHSTAQRFTDNAHAAEEITQAVFIILAGKAGKLSPSVVLAGWLYQTARLTAANFVKGEIRRQAREQEAYMQSTLTEPDPAAWQQIAPLLDEAMGRLGETDRNAVLLRFFENKTAQEVGAALKLNEAAAHKRTERAVEKLRKFFSQRGVTMSAAFIAGAVSANSVQAAPVGLAISTVAAIKGSAVSVSTLTLVKGTLKLMTYAKLKLAVGLAAGILLAGGAVTVAISQTGGGDKLAAGEIFKKAQATYAALTSYSDDGKSVATLNGTTITHTFSIKLARPELYRIEWAQSSASAAYNSTTATQSVWSAGAGDFMLNRGGSTTKYKDKETVLASATGISGGAAATIPGTFFKMNWGNQLGSSTAKQKQLADEKVGDVDCYVFASDVKGRTRTIWIGKQDFLIHQVRTLTSAAVMKAVMDEGAKLHPEIAARLPKMEYTDSTATETHENIVVNQKFSAADFAR
jgi:RNA polymerase sigma factor (sigma-70 family)